MSDFLTIRKPDDFHVHLRGGDTLRHVLPHTIKSFRRALVMPNVPPVRDAKTLVEIRSEIVTAVSDYRARAHQIEPFMPLMAIMLTDFTTPEIIREAHDVGGAVAAKLYPMGATTGSENGVSMDVLWNLESVFAEMERVGMVLSLHGEMPRYPILEREECFLTTLQEFVRRFPNLRIVLEHVSSAAAIECVKSLPHTVAATITLHHMLTTIEDVIGDRLRPHLFCKPVPKTEKDRAAILAAARSGNPKFFFGSDSAPHMRTVKECDAGAAGVFSAPVALPLLVETIGLHQGKETLENFTSRFGARFYGLPLNKEKITLRKHFWKVPEICPGDIVPFWAGKMLSWSIA